ncbi:MAG: response regulator [Ardenticatenia bacterium]|nr:response regulator [Ardenticatenia bacterium]
MSNRTRPRRVLIVDDEPNIVISLEFLMQQAGYDVHVARTGEEAVELIQRLEPDLVLLDIMLPGIDGFEICRWVRENPAWDKVKIIMLTAKGRDVDIAKGFALGADAYITKPFSTKDLMAEVERVLEQA